MSTPTTHKAVIGQWPTKAEFARAIGVSPNNARQMSHAGIPPKYFGAVIEAAKAAGFPELTYAQLSEMLRAES